MSSFSNRAWNDRMIFHFPFLSILIPLDLHSRIGIRDNPDELLPRIPEKSVRSDPRHGAVESVLFFNAFGSILPASLATRIGGSGFQPFRDSSVERKVVRNTDESPLSQGQDVETAISLLTDPTAIEFILWYERTYDGDLGLRQKAFLYRSPTKAWDAIIADREAAAESAVDAAVAGV